MKYWKYILALVLVIIIIIIYCQGFAGFAGIKTSKSLTVSKDATINGNATIDGDAVIKGSLTASSYIDAVDTSLSVSGNINCAGSIYTDGDFYGRNDFNLRRFVGGGDTNFRITNAGSATVYYNISDSASTYGAHQFFTGTQTGDLYYTNNNTALYVSSNSIDIEAGLALNVRGGHISFYGKGTGATYAADNIAADSATGTEAYYSPYTYAQITPEFTTGQYSVGTLSFNVEIYNNATDSTDYGNYKFFGNKGSDRKLYLTIDQTGITVAGNVTADNVTNSSDYRLKENIEPLSDDYTIDDLKPCSYHLISDETKKKNTGFIAHELQEVFPHLVIGEKDGEDTQTVNYIGLIAILTKELQGLKSIVKDLQLKNISLEEKHISLEEKISQLL